MAASAQWDPAEALLRIEDLHVHFHTDAGVVRAVDGVGYEVRRGETLAVVGESGCGKSVTAMAVLGLVPRPPGVIAGGSIRFEGEELVGAPEDRLRQIRGNDVSMIFQEPMSSLNPVFTIGDQIAESLLLHRGLGADDAQREAVRALERVGIPSPAQRARDYPHQLSGGMCQRAMIAMALACEPKLLIADEPTTALDVTVQAQILDLLRKLQSETGMSIVLITHDLGVVAEMAHRVVVMYAGSIVERASVEDLFERPRHPYTAGLMHSIPKVHGGETRLQPVEGNVPDALDFPSGCKFHPRCALALDRCASEAPPEMQRNARGLHRSACWAVDADPERDLLAALEAGEGA